MKNVSHLVFAAMLASGAALGADDEFDFDRADTNGDGQLTESEWQDVDYLVVAFDAADANSDGRVDRGEAAEAQQQRNAAGATGAAETPARSGQPEQAQDAFQRADADGDRRVSRDEAEQAGYEYVVVFFDPLDVNRDGYIDEIEWNPERRAGSEAATEQRAAAQDVPVQTEERATRELSETPIAVDGEDARTGAGEIQRGAASAAGEATGASGGDRVRADMRDYPPDAGVMGIEEDFENYDANGDGYLDEDEVAGGGFIDVNFDDIDANDDGLIDIGEAEDGFLEWGESDVYDVDPAREDDRR